MTARAGLELARAVRLLLWPGGQIKKYCRDGHKPFVPLRSANAASFIAAIGQRNVLQDNRRSRI